MVDLRFPEFRRPDPKISATQFQVVLNLLGVNGCQTLPVRNRLPLPPHLAM